MPSAAVPATAQTAAAVQTIPTFINGKWVPSASTRTSDVFNPSTGQVIARAPLSTPAEVDAAVRAAADALPQWAATPVVERCRVLFKFREILLSRFEELTRLVTREHGKTLAEARASVHRGIEV